ncbi:hypothetical protein FAGKG844_220046 [Frankia sp. AgKG'84/4]
MTDPLAARASRAALRTAARSIRSYVRKAISSGDGFRRETRAASDQGQRQFIDEVMHERVIQRLAGDE